MKATTKQPTTSNNNNTNVTNVKESAVSKALKLKTTTTTKDEQMKTTTTTTKEKVKELPKQKEKKEVVNEQHHFGLTVDAIVTFTHEGKEYKGQVLRFGLIKKTGRSRCRVIFLDDKNKLTNQHKGFYSSNVKPTGDMGKDSTKVKFKEIKTKKA
jgi:hypothetical protein